MDHGPRYCGAINKFSGPTELWLLLQPPQRESGWEVGAWGLGSRIQPPASTSLLQPPLSFRATLPKCKTHFVPPQGLRGTSAMKSQPLSLAFKARPCPPLQLQLLPLSAADILNVSRLCTGRALCLQSHCFSCLPGEHHLSFMTQPWCHHLQEAFPGCPMLPRST